MNGNTLHFHELKNNVKIAMLLKVTYRFRLIPIIVPMALLIDMKKNKTNLS